MVSPATPSRDRLLAAAAAEFAARGFDGATVDRIAARARLNKAMLYYHFKSKAALYREILVDMFRSVAEGVERVNATGLAPDARLGAFIDAIVEQATAHPHFPNMWLREVAEGGRHLDDSIVVEVRRVVGALAQILGDGQARGMFRPAHPFVIQFSIIAPLMFFQASQPVRVRFRDSVPPGVATPPFEAIVAHVKASTLAALRIDAVPGPAPRTAVRSASRRPRS